MQLFGYPDFLGVTQRNRTTMALKARLDTVSQEAVTGRRQNVTLAVNGNIGEIHLVEKALDDIEQGTRISDLSKVRLNMTNQALSGARNALNGISSRAYVALQAGGSASVNTIADEAEESLRSAMSALSIKQGSRNLLSGAATQNAPFADADLLLSDMEAIMQSGGTTNQINTQIETYFNDPSGGFFSRIYTGGTDNAPPLQIGNGKKLDMPIRGDNKAVRDTLRGLAVLAMSTQSPHTIGSDEFASIYGAGVTAAAEAETGLIGLETDLGILNNAIDKARSRNQLELISLNTVYQGFIGRDQFDAAAELKQLEVALESSYIITSRISKLSLTKYL